jgi:hypothetical protein
MPNSKSNQLSSSPSIGRPGTILNLASRITPEQYLPLLRYVQRLHAERFFGDLLIQFTKGDITLIRVEQTLKPWDLADAESPAMTLGTAGGSNDPR